MQVKNKLEQYAAYLKSGGQLGLQQWEAEGLFDWALAGQPNPTIKELKILTISFLERGMISQKISTGTVYICGPITGLPLNNYQAFEEAENQLTKLGIHCVNPHNLFDQINHNGFTHGDYMQACISALAFCDTIVTLPGWENSKGALMEVRIARLMEKEVSIIEQVIKNITKAA